MANELYGVPLKIDEPMLAPQELVDEAEKIREQHHAERLDGARIAYVIRPGSDRQGARVELGKTKACSAVEALLSEHDFIISINWFAWQGLDDRQRRALLDHELTHCEPKLDSEGERTGWGIRHHDVEDFTEVVNRRGLWTSDLEAFAPIAVRKQKLADAKRKKAKRQGKLQFAGGRGAPKREAAATAKAPLADAAEG